MASRVTSPFVPVSSDAQSNSGARVRSRYSFTGRCPSGTASAPNDVSIMLSFSDDVNNADGKVFCATSDVCGTVKAVATDMDTDSTANAEAIMESFVIVKQQYSVGRKRVSAREREREVG